eukprot:m51a1_g5998 putative 8-amino-7-oxononanoate synthase (378) ;mRNA; f:4232-9234
MSTSTTDASPFDPRLVSAGFKEWEKHDAQFRGVPTGDGHVEEAGTGRRLADFGMCSFLGLEKFPAMVEGARRAMEECGLFTSASRAYVELPLLREVEELVGAKFGGHFLLLPKTHIGSNLWATTTVGPRDGLVLDREVHVSIHFATDLARARGVPKAVVPNGDLEAAVAEIRRLEAAGAERVWYCTDGLHSMNGTPLRPDFARALLDASPRVRLFVDDAHGVGWTGPGGRGQWLEAFPANDRMVVAVSFCKAVAVGGGGLLFGSKDDRDYAMLGGLPGHWTGPMTPPELGALRAFLGWIDTRICVQSRKLRLREKLMLGIPVSELENLPADRGPYTDALSVIMARPIVSQIEQWTKVNYYPLFMEHPEWEHRCLPGL